MNGRTRGRVLAAMLLSSAAAACGSAPASPAPGPRPEAKQPSEAEAIYWARVHSARAHYVSADVHFLAGMILHHGQAIRMAGMVPDRTTTRAIRALAGRILISQRDEIALMQRWLRDRGEDVPEVGADGSPIGGHAEHHAHHDGPGMLTEEQFRLLESASGPEFDRLFLVFMIEHHQGAVTMVRELLAADGAANDPEIFRIASDVQADQIAEVGRMERLLAQLPAAGRTP